MSGRDILQKICRIGLKVIGYVSFIAPLLTRLLVGHLFYLSGKGKLEHIERPIAFFTKIGIPFPQVNAYFIGTLEYVGGIGLMIGLFARPFAALLGATMIVALITASKQSFLEGWNGADENGNEKSLFDVLEFVLGMLLLWIMMYGPGLLSVDAILRKWIGVDKPDETKSATPPPQTPA
jgi:putative oxidoreductase